jgi:hypothetical protein
MCPMCIGAGIMLFAGGVTSGAAGMFIAKKRTKDKERLKTPADKKHNGKQ